MNRSDSTKGLGIVQAKDNRKGWYFRPNYLTTLLCVIISALGNSQSLSELKSNLQELENSKGRLESTVVQMDHKIEKVKLRIIHEQLKEIGFPTNDPIVHHEAMSLAYAEKTEQAKWVMHIISPEIIEGTVHRTNDFRIDTMVNSGSAQELDYFIKTRNADGEFEYDGFGFDRGHLAPSADFRWSGIALSESYFYSNMSPQLPGFNREKWAELENFLRNYIINNDQNHLIVVTGPIFDGDTNVIDRSVNGVAVPSRFFKVALDPVLKRAVGFILPHEEGLSYPIETYMTSVEEVEKVTGFNFFPNYEHDTCKRSFSPKFWSPALSKGDVNPFSATKLPRAHFNTIDAKNYIQDGSRINVVGTVVSTRKSRKGNLLINLDKKFPNQIFTVFIRKEHIVNFSYDPLDFFKGKAIVVKGKVNKMGGTPTIYLESEKHVDIFDDSR